MTATRRIWLAVAVLLVAIVVGAGLWLRSYLSRPDRDTPEQLQAQIAALESERADLRQRLEDLVVRDPRLEGMPSTPVRVGVPTALAGQLIERVIGGVVDQVTIELKNLRARKQGTVRRVITLGDYDLRVTVDRVVGTLRTAPPKLTFGGNRVAMAMPLRVASGSGNATINFKWDGRNVSGAVCGDMDVTLPVSGTVRPRAYPVSAALALSSNESQIVVQPRLPVIRLNLQVSPSEASWKAAQDVLDSKGGVCGFVLDRVDIMGLVRRLVDKGFNVRLPTERVKAVAMPVGIEPTMTVRGQPVTLGIKVEGLSITEHAIWLGAHVAVAFDGDAPIRRLLPTSEPPPR